jgi:MFS family permease
MLLATLPALVGLLIAWYVPESPRWLAEVQAGKGEWRATPTAELFRPPLLGRTVIGILLGTVPLLGAWGASKWLIPWAEVEGSAQLKAETQSIWALGAVLGSAAGGWLANLLGRRTTYFLISLGSLAVSLSIYQFVTPAAPAFRPLAFLLGLVATLFFGWLPLYLPELFPTRVRATGSGVAFNFGRFASAAGLAGAATLMGWFGGDYARVGSITAWIYGVGMVVILFAPDTRSVPE